ncbi:MAG: hypothetical protein RL885_02495 [Planctomycetota bacterium]
MNTIFSLLICVAPVVGQVEPQAEQGPLLLAHYTVWQPSYPGTDPEAAEGSAYLIHGEGDSHEIFRLDGLVEAPVSKGRQRLPLPLRDRPGAGLLFVLPRPGVPVQFTPYLEAFRMGAIGRSDLPRRLVFDPQRLETVLYELVSRPGGPDGQSGYEWLGVRSPELVERDLRIGYAHPTTAALFGHPDLGGAAGAHVLDQAAGGMYFETDQPLEDLTLRFGPRIQGPGHWSDRPRGWVLWDFDLGGLPLAQGTFLPAEENVPLPYPARRFLLTVHLGAEVPHRESSKDWRCNDRRDDSESCLCDRRVECRNRYQILIAKCDRDCGDCDWNPPPPHPVETVVETTLRLTESHGTTISVQSGRTVSLGFGPWSAEARLNSNDVRASLEDRESAHTERHRIQSGEALVTVTRQRVCWWECLECVVSLDSRAECIACSHDGGQHFALQGFSQEIREKGDPSALELLSPGGAETMRCTDLNGKHRVKGNPNIYVDFCHE